MNKISSKIWSFFPLLGIIFLQSTQLFSWSTPAQISGTGMNFQPKSAINATGEAEIVWISGSFPTYSVESSTFSGVSWSTPSTLVSGLIDNPIVGIDSAGNAVAVWLESVLGNIVVKSASKPAAGIWSAPIILSTSTSNRNLTLKMNGSGNTIAGWIDAVTNNVQAAYLNFGGAWSAPVIVALGLGISLDLQIGIDSAGNGYAVWVIFEGNDIYAATSLGPVWSPPVLLNINGDNTSPSIGVGGVLQALVSWQNQNISEIRTLEFSAGTWTNIPSIISTDNVGIPAVAATGGDGFVTWQDLNTGKIQASNLNGGLWSQQPQDITPSTNNELPTISVLSDGTGVIAWSDFTNETIDIVFYPNGGIPGVPQTISLVGDNTNTHSVSSGLKTIATWQTSTGNDSVIFANIN